MQNVWVCRMPPWHKRARGGFSSHSYWVMGPCTTEFLTSFMKMGTAGTGGAKLAMGREEAFCYTDGEGGRENICGVCGGACLGRHMEHDMHGSMHGVHSATCVGMCIGMCTESAWECAQKVHKARTGCARSTHGSVRGVCMGAVSMPGSVNGDSRHARERAQKLGACKGVCMGAQKKYTVKEPEDGSLHSSMHDNEQQSVHSSTCAWQCAGSVPGRHSKHTTAARKATDRRRNV